MDRKEPSLEEQAREFLKHGRRVRAQDLDSLTILQLLGRGLISKDEARRMVEAPWTNQNLP